MNLIKNSFRIAIILMIAPLISMSAYAQTTDEIKIATARITDNLYMLQGWGGNMTVLFGDNGTFMVDHPSANQFAKVKETIDSLGGGPIKYLFNTHYHRDHTGGNDLINQQGATVYAHKNVYRTLSSGWKIDYFEIENPPLSKEWLSEVFIPDEMTYNVNNENINTFHLANAHSDGDVAIYFEKANVISVGDIFFNEMYPFIDLENGGTFKGLLKGLDTILGIINQDTKVIPGHGPLTDFAGLKNYRDMLAEFVASIQAMIDSGKTLEQAIAAKPTAKYDETNAGFIPPDDMVKFIYDDLSK
ncbi:MAG: MBL fold metallo-hydrolase [candidate division Zixibacteria bacterium]